MILFGPPKFCIKYYFYFLLGLTISRGQYCHYLYLHCNALFTFKWKSKVKWCIYVAPLSQTSQRRFTMINLPPADWKHIQAQMVATSKQSMHAGAHFTDLGRMESWVNFSGKEGRQIFHSRQNREWNPGSKGWKAEILPLRQPPPPNDTDILGTKRFIPKGFDTDILGTKRFIPKGFELSMFIFPKNCYLV